jgi:DNA-binding NtrC family response regulator
MNGRVVNGEDTRTATVAEEDEVCPSAVQVRLSGSLASCNGVKPLSRQLFLERLDEERTRAGLHRRSFALTAIMHQGTAELEPLLAALNPFDKLCLYAPTVWLVLLPELSESGVRSWCDSLQAKNGNAFSIGVATFTALTGTSSTLVSAALEACRRTQPGHAKTAGLAVLGSSEQKQPVVLSPSMNALYALAERAAATSMPVLIQGEPGSGKELVARAVHAASRRACRPFKVLNCGAIPASLVESTLFGHERGAFTGAERQAQGLFEQACGGTLFLDEIGELPLTAQTALLRVLEHGRVVRVGGRCEFPVDVRVVAATHRDLRVMATVSSFREDLMFRLDAMTLQVPPLRERREEILPLAQYFLARARTTWGTRATHLSAGANEALLSYCFPGNVRELKNAIERAAVVCHGDEVQREDLPPYLVRQRSEESVTERVGAACDWSE